MMRPITFAIALTWIGGCGMPEKRPDEVSALGMTVTDVASTSKGEGPLSWSRQRWADSARGLRHVCLSSRHNPCVGRSIEKFQQYGLKEVSAGPEDVGVELDGVCVDGIRAPLTVRPLTVVSAR
jgi:hypothetical protein